MKCWAVRHNFERGPPDQRPIPAKCGLIWFSGFKEEDLNVKVYDVRQMDAQKHILCREPPNKHSYQIWFQLTQWFQRRRLKCKRLQTTTTDTKWWQYLTLPFGSDKLASICIFVFISSVYIWKHVIYPWNC
jgi:hypothetical protein